eukprot:CAMPEP_0204570810 /NCGR_PEP_ID=MMETSP0661-20131031/38534_1 /ASSEMBLY_ACC=CAM_ASM_000606 /TAXON_ID=109239 /ORGANISM="Alexandrium margalefi, Strain AMGDE01CS-322" /LENGTH=63 /DNA_ID=CAMNT_0051579025 /DNA_START=29 /DNA_END=217 /DNA_ORIENTATION=-
MTNSCGGSSPVFRAPDMFFLRGRSARPRQQDRPAVRGMAALRAAPRRDSVYGAWLFEVDDGGG